MADVDVDFEDDAVLMEGTLPAVARRLPGKPRPGPVALAEYEEFNSLRRKDLTPALWPLLAPNAEEICRWRVQLRCRCITEVLTYGDNTPPDQQRWPDLAHKVLLPAGQLICVHDDALPAPYRTIKDWGRRREVSFPADSAQPPAWAEEETWAIIRRDQPHASAFWTVTLACGHATEAVTDLDWRPADRPHRVSAERQHEMVAEHSDYWTAHPNEQSTRDREHTERMLAAGWPRPQPEHLCYRCSWAQPVVAYQRIGRLKTTATTLAKPAPPSREELERRLHRAEADARRIRRQIAETEV